MSETNEAKRKFSLKQTVQILLRAYRVIHEISPGYLSLSTATSLIDALKPLIALFMSARIINELSGTRNVQIIIVYVTVTVLSVFLLSVLGTFLNRRLSLINEYNYTELELLYMKKYMEMDYKYTEDSHVSQMLADIRARANGNGLGIMNLFWITPNLLRNLATLLISLAMLVSMFVPVGEYTRNWVTSSASSLFLVLLAVISLIAPLFIRKAQKKVLDWILRENPKANSLFFFYFEYKNVNNAAKDIRLYDQADTIVDIFNKRLNLKMWFWFFRRNAFASGISGAVNSFIGGAIYLFIGLRALYGMYPIGSVVQYVGAVTNFVLNISNLSGDIGWLWNNIEYMQYIYDFLDLNAPPAKGSAVLETKDIDIEFINVSFKYPDTETYALKDVSLKFKHGKRLAVVGMNGSGKTTMVKLLCRLYTPTEGVIRLNGIDIQSYDYAEYVRLFNVVFQDFKLFSLSLGSNVAMADEYDREKAESALITAGFEEKLRSLDKGLDTYIGKDCDKEGVAFSGGEQQKVAIARAIYRDSPFVVFDEPTAALDPISEFEVYTKLNDIVGNKTAVFISHRLSSCRFCDEIAVFHEGKIVQFGGHDTLLADLNGKYAELWNAQAQYYKDSDNLVNAD